MVGGRAREGGRRRDGGGTDGAKMDEEGDVFGSVCGCGCGERERERERERESS